MDTSNEKHSPIEPDTPLKDEDSFLKSLSGSIKYFKSINKGEFAAGILLAYNRYKDNYPTQIFFDAIDKVELIEGARSADTCENVRRVYSQMKHEYYENNAVEPSSKEQEGIWLYEKPEFNRECTFVTATKYDRNDEDLQWDYSVWQIKKLDGENEEGEPGWYWGLLNGDGEEWGDLEDLTVTKYFIIPNKNL